MSTTIDREGREARIRDVQKWGTTEAAENTALAIIAAIPDGLPFLGIFPTGFDEDTETGDGGIRLQRSTAKVVIVVDVNAAGDIDDCYRTGDDEYVEVKPGSPQDAAAFLTT